MRKLIVGNWKMNGRLAQIAEIKQIAAETEKYPVVDGALCLPATLIGPAVQACPNLPIGAQDCHMHGSGAYTGCISAVMLADVGATMVILGHSERRAGQSEHNDDVRAKADAALAARLHTIICVGETEAERDAGKALSAVMAQLEGSMPTMPHAGEISVAYEPVWAIGTGRIPSLDDVGAMHAAIRGHLLARLGDQAPAMRILYGGSMNGDNAADLLALPNVDGGLIGGASLTAAKFAPILAAAAAV